MAFRCGLGACLNVYTTHRTVQEHAAVQHFGLRLFCVGCDKSYTTAKAMLRHQQQRCVGARREWRPVDVGEVLPNGPMLAVMNAMNGIVRVAIAAFAPVAVGLAPDAVDANVPVVVAHNYDVPQHIVVPGVGNVIVEAMVHVPIEPNDQNAMQREAEEAAFVVALLAGERIEQGDFAGEFDDYLGDDLLNDFDLGVGGLAAPLQVNNFICNLCQVGFLDVVAMRDHLDVHVHGMADGGAI